MLACRAGLRRRRPPAPGINHGLFRGLTRAARSYLGYEDLEVVQAGPEGAADDGKPDMFEGQEEVCAARERPSHAWLSRLRPPPAPCRAGAQGVVAAPARLHGQGHYVAHVRASLHHGETPTSASLRRASARPPAPRAAVKAALGATRACTLASCAGLTRGAAFGRAQEPTSVLQKMAEIMEYSELLDKAAECEARCVRAVTRAPLPPLRGTPR